MRSPPKRVPRPKRATGVPATSPNYLTRLDGIAAAGSSSLLFSWPSLALRSVRRKSAAIELVEADVQRRGHVQGFDGTRSGDRESSRLQCAHLLAWQAARFVAEDIAVEFPELAGGDGLAFEIQAGD